MIKRVEIITKKEIAERISQMAAEISAEYENRSPVFLGVLKGAFMFLADLVRELSIPVEIDFVWLSSYGDDTASSGKVRLHTPPRMDLGGRDVIVVEDIVDTGPLYGVFKKLFANGATGCFNENLHVTG